MKLMSDHIRTTLYIQLLLTNCLLNRPSSICSPFHLSRMENIWSLICLVGKLTNLFYLITQQVLYFFQVSRVLLPVDKKMISINYSIKSDATRSCTIGTNTLGKNERRINLFAMYRWYLTATCNFLLISIVAICNIDLLIFILTIRCSNCNYKDHVAI